MTVPPEYMRSIEFTDLERWPEFTQPLLADNDFELGFIQARAHVGVLDYHRGDYELVGYVRTPWRTVRKKFRNILQRLIFNPTDANF